MMDQKRTGWVTTRELAGLLGKSYDATRKYAQRGGYTLLRQTKALPRSRGGKIWLININDPVIPDSARERYFSQGCPDRNRPTKWIPAREAAKILGISKAAFHKNRRKGRYVTKKVNANGGDQYYVLLQCLPNRESKRRCHHFHDLKEELIPTITVMRGSVDRILQEVKSFNLAFNRFADLFCSFCQDQDEATR